MGNKVLKKRLPASGCNDNIDKIANIGTADKARFIPLKKKRRNTDQFIIIANCAKMRVQAAAESLPPHLQPGGRNEKAFPF
jgi:hypothetical protein